MYKKVQLISAKTFVQNAPGFLSVDNFAHEIPIEPYLVFTEFHMSRHIFGPHPHAGVSVMTYMLPQSEGAFINRDSRGDYSIIEPGGIHVTQAGSGIKHDEVPEVDGTDCHGFQIWINHADKDRFVEPKAYHAFAKDIQQYEDADKKVRIIQGQYKNCTAPFELLTKVVLLDVVLAPGKSIELEALPAAFIYVIDGKGTTAGEAVETSNLVVYETAGDTVEITAGDSALHFLFACGIPHNEPIVYGGPYVATTTEQLSIIKKRYGQGEMGVLEPLQ